MRDDVETLSLDQLDAVTGGNWLTSSLRVAGRVGGRLVPVVGWAANAYGAYQGTNAYLDARNRGESVGASLLRGAGAFIGLND